MFFEMRNAIFNRVIIWMMKHCRCSCGVFYTACGCYHPASVRNMVTMYLEEKTLDKLH